MRNVLGSVIETINVNSISSTTELHGVPVVNVVTAGVGRVPGHNLGVILNAVSTVTLYPTEKMSAISFIVKFRGEGEMLGKESCNLPPPAYSTLLSEKTLALHAEVHATTDIVPDPPSTDKVRALTSLV